MYKTKQKKNTSEHSMEARNLLNCNTTYSNDIQLKNSIDEITLSSDKTEPSDERKYSMVEVAENVVEAKRDDNKTKTKHDFDIEKLKPFFIQFEDHKEEITELQICNNILMFLLTLVLLLLVFLSGIGVALSSYFKD